MYSNSSKWVTQMPEETIIIRIEKENLDPNFLRSLVDVDGCGSVVSFVGLTRGDDNAVSYTHLRAHET